MPYLVYKLIHIFAVMLLFVSLGGLAALRQGTSGAVAASLSRLLGILHGVALLLVAGAGFGLMAKIGIHGAWPLWIWIKLGVWVLLGAALAAVRRSPEGARAVLLGLPLLGAIAAWAALYKVGPLQGRLAPTLAAPTFAANPGEEGEGTLALFG